jgi:hypothetical protein
MAAENSIELLVKLIKLIIKLTNQKALAIVHEN